MSDTQHHPDCRCRHCARLDERVMTLVEWRTIHHSHGVEMTVPFPHPSGDWCRHVCVCGAGLITKTAEALAAMTAASLKRRALR